MKEEKRERGAPDDARSGDRKRSMNKSFISEIAVPRNADVTTHLRYPYPTNHLSGTKRLDV